MGRAVVVVVVRLLVVVVVAWGDSDGEDREEGERRERRVGVVWTRCGLGKCILLLASGRNQGKERDIKEMKRKEKEPFGVDLEPGYRPTISWLAKRFIGLV